MADDVTVVTVPDVVITLIDNPTVLVLQANGGTGPVGPQGPPGTPGGFRFIYTQVSPAATWIITHGIGSLVNVTLLNSAGAVVDADIIETSLNVTTVMFSTPQTGTAIIT